MIFDPYPPLSAVLYYYPSAILANFWPSPLKHADVLKWTVPNGIIFVCTTKLFIEGLKFGPKLAVNYLWNALGQQKQQNLLTKICSMEICEFESKFSLTF